MKSYNGNDLYEIKIGKILNNVPTIFLRLYVDRYFTIVQLILDCNANTN